MTKTKGTLIAETLLRLVKGSAGSVTDIRSEDGILSFKMVDHYFMIVRVAAQRGLRGRYDAGTIHLFVLEDGEKTQVKRETLARDLDDWGIIQHLSQRIYEVFEQRQDSKRASIIDRVYYAVTQQRPGTGLGHIYDGGRA